MQLPVGGAKYITAPAHWEHWLVRLNSSFTDHYQTTEFDRNILINLMSLYCAFSIGQGIMGNAKIYNGFTCNLVDLAHGAMGTCIKRDLALYLVNMCVLVLDSISDVPPLNISEDKAKPADPPLPSSPLISTAADIPNASAHDSGYKSTDSMPSLLTVEDSSDKDRRYLSDSSEDPEPDPEEDAMIAEGFIVDEEASDLDL